MQLITLYLATAVVFLGLDAVMLKAVMRPLFEPRIGPLMLEDFRLGPAAVFYLFYVAGLLYLVSYPALKAGTGLGMVTVSAAVIGAMAYGTYEFTNYAIMRDWDISMVLTDFAWGTVLTAASATAGLAITRWII